MNIFNFFEKDNDNDNKQPDSNERKDWCILI